MLEDPESMILPQNIVPLMRERRGGEHHGRRGDRRGSAALTTEELTKLNKLVDVDKQDPDQVAADWLKSKGLA